MQPFLAILQGRPWAQADIFGITPDPTVVATLGVLLTTDARARWVLLVIPIAWCAVGGTLLWTMEDPGFVVLAVAGVASVIGAVARRRGRTAAASGRSA